MKKMLAVILSVLCLTGTVLAAEPVASTESGGFLSTFLTPFYSGEADSYTIYDENGNDISNSFLSSTSALYTEADWAAIKATYKMMNVDYIEKITSEEAVSITRGTDLAETVTATKYEIVECESGGGHDIEVGIEQRGTFYYDANTFRVTQVSKPVIEYLAISYGSNNLNYTTPVRTGSIYSTYKAKFSTYFDISDMLYYDGIVWAEYDYGRFTHTFYGEVT